MALRDQILELIQTNPSTALQVAERLNIKKETSKVTLWKLWKDGKIVREKEPLTEKKKGPQMEYVYKPSMIETKL